MEFAFKCAEDAKKLAKSGGINLKFISTPNHTVLNNSSANCEEVKNIIDNILARLSRNITFEINLNKVYKLLFSPKVSKQESLIIIDSDYKSKYEQLKRILNQYKNILIRTCKITPNIKSSLINIFGFFIDMSNDGGLNYLIYRTYHQQMY